MDDQNQQNIQANATSNDTASQFIKTGGVQKEMEPISSSENTEELIRPSEVEYNLHSEVEKAGVEKVSERINLPEEAKTMGLTHAGESVPVPTQPSGVVQLLNETEARSPGDNPDDSASWLKKLLKRVLERINNK